MKSVVEGVIWLIGNLNDDHCYTVMERNGDTWVPVLSNALEAHEDAMLQAQRPGTGRVRVTIESLT